MTTYVSDKFSWHRVGMVARFYYPQLRLPLMLYPTVAFAIGVICTMLNTSETGTVFSGLLSLLTSGMFYLFPLFLCRGASPAVETMLPATPNEKLTFYVILCVIVNPILVMVPLILGQNITEPFITVDPTAIAIQQSTWKFFADTYGISMLQSLAPMVTCMFVVITCWHNRIGKAIGFTVLTILVLSIIGGVYGIYMALSETFEHIGPAGFDKAADVSTEVIESITSSMKYFVISLGLLSAAYTALMIWLASRKLRSLQV